MLPSLPGPVLAGEGIALECTLSPLTFSTLRSSCSVCLCAYCSLFEKDGARVVVDQSSLQLLAGSTVDYEDEMMKSAFVVTDNPQSAQGCGCGTSFSVEI